MLITAQNLPMRNDGIPWGTVLIAVIIIGGVGYMSYQALKPIEPTYSPKKT